jgi:hypothetical protein
MGPKRKSRVVNAALKVRENLWQFPSHKDSYSTYDSFVDPHCPWAIALKHNLFESARAAKLLDGRKNDEAALEARQAATSFLAPLREDIPKDRWLLPAVAISNKQTVGDFSRAQTPPARSTRPSLRTARKEPSATADDSKTRLHVSWQESENFDDAEFRCLRCIVRRDSLIDDLRDSIGLIENGVKSNGVTGLDSGQIPTSVLVGMLGALREVNATSATVRKLWSFTCSAFLSFVL